MLSKQKKYQTCFRHAMTVIWLLVSYLNPFAMMFATYKVNIAFPESQEKKQANSMRISIKMIKIVYAKHYDLFKRCSH